MAGTHHGEVPPVQSGDGGDAEAFGEGDQGGVGSAQAQIGVAAHQLGDPGLIAMFEVLDSQAAVADRVEQPGFRFGAELAVDEVGRFGDDQGVGDKRPRVGLEQVLAGLVVGVVGIGGGGHAGVDQQHSVAPETLGQQLVGLRAAPGLARSPEGHEGQMTA